MFCILLFGVLRILAKILKLDQQRRPACDFFLNCASHLHTCAASIVVWPTAHCVWPPLRPTLARSAPRRLRPPPSLTLMHRRGTETTARAEWWGFNKCSDWPEWKVEVWWRAHSQPNSRFHPSPTLHLATVGANKLRNKTTDAKVISPVVRWGATPIWSRHLCRVA